MMEQKRRTWAEVSLQSLAENYHALRAITAQDCRFMGMVKSDAYGHGALAVSRELQALGADYLGVACLDEAIELREGGITLPILILGGSAREDLPLLLEYRLAQTVFDLETARHFSQQAQEQGQTLTVHCKVDTGMARLGFLGDEENLVQTVQALSEIHAMQGLAVEGIFTHFADADAQEEAYTLLQMTRFLDVLDKLEEKDCHFAIRHAANSAATLLYPFSHLDMVRPGIALYGHHPSSETQELCILAPVMELRSRISAIRTVPRDSFVSYGRTQKLARDSVLALIPIGYGDGYCRGFSSRAEIGIGAARARIVGRVCMDMCMVDITDLGTPQVGDEVVIYSRDEARGPLVEACAALVGSISYELLCALSKRIPRIYSADKDRGHAVLWLS